LSPPHLVAVLPAVLAWWECGLFLVEREQEWLENLTLKKASIHTQRKDLAEFWLPGRFGSQMYEGPGKTFKDRKCLCPIHFKLPQMVIGWRIFQLLPYGIARL
jgi:hypothetical protein